MGLISCQAQGLGSGIPPKEAFFTALLAENSPNPEGDEATKSASFLYQRALTSASPVIRREAAKRLLLLNAGQQDPALNSRLAELADEPWGRAASLLAGGGLDGPARPELIALFLGQPVDQFYRWALEQAGGAEGLSPAESAAIAGRLAVSRSAYGEAMARFVTVLAQEPALFTRYGELLTDLGRSFQFTASGRTGTELFLAWEGEQRESTPQNAETPPDLRYRLLYFAGRIERQRGNYAEAAEHFQQAAAMAPDPLQADACIWYILSMGLEKPEEMADLLKIWVKEWHNAAYFDDIMDRFSRQLVTKKQWQPMLEVYRLFKPQAGGSSRSQYAYILGRAAELGYLPGAEAQALFKAAREEEGASFYYRALASRRLGGPVLAIPDTPGASRVRADPAPNRRKRRTGRSPPQDKPPQAGPERNFPHPDEMDFLLGFFQYNAARLAWPYIAGAEGGLSIPELQELAGALQEAGLWGESLRLIGSYREREGPVLNRKDWELYYPRPYRELVETYGAEQNIPPWFLFGLIRVESAFTADIDSRAGAKGLTQLMPDTAEEMAARLSRQGGPDYRREGGINLADPETNIRLGAVYLRYLQDRLKNPMLTLLAYNGGMGRLRRWQAGAPGLPADLLAETVEFNETRDYGRKVAAAAAVYGFLYYDLTLEGGIADMLE
ncbi:MAG: lytic transglycosylase domain-containing protein [Treponema sp.]|jgi:soluble lytic murein transglycosylase|nr:lytic transglycosylase domain-containing protein [Treponema sp.]